MLSAWEDVFALSRISIAELDVAAAIIARNPPRWRSDHLLALQSTIREGRIQQVRMEREREEFTAGVSVCRICSSTGRVIVPHPRFVVDGQWQENERGVSITAAVVCSCHCGRRLLDQVLSLSADERKRARVQMPMILADFEKICPDWAEQMRNRELAKLAEIKALNQASAHDKCFGKIKTLAESLGKVFNGLR